MLFINALKLYVPGSLGLEYYVHVWKGVYIHACVHCTVTYICTYFHMYKHTYIHTYMNTYICTYTQIYTNKQTYLQTYIHAYIHTHSHPYVNTQIHTVRTVLTYRDTTMSKNVSHAHKHKVHGSQLGSPLGCMAHVQIHQKTGRGPPLVHH